MRVLWFTGVQLPALTSQGLTRAGWQEGLRKALETYQPQVELGIATFGAVEIRPFTKGNATYFTLPRKTPQDRWARWWNAWQHSSYTADEYEHCLEMVESFKPDLVHFHGSENFFGLISARLSTPSVLSIQAIVNGYFPFFFSDLSLPEVLRQCATRSFLRGEGPLHKWLTWRKYVRTEAQILRGCRNYMGRTEWDHALVLAFHPEADYYHCDEALADQYYSLEWQPEGTDRNIIYSTSSGGFHKGSLLLAKAVAILKQRGWKDLKLHLAGINPNYDVGKFLIAFIREQHLEEDVVLFERLTPEQIGEEMLRAGVYVHPSHIDNSPNSLCEAMLTGMPCIAAHAGGVPSLVKDGVDGLLYHDRDAYMLADKIIRVLSDPRLSAKLGKQARRTALARHDRQRIARRTVEIYQQVVAGQA